MNLKIHTVISDIDGKSGLAIINAILSGERDPEKLANLCDSRIKAPREEIIKSLEGFWLKEHLFELSQCYKLYEFHNEMILECDTEIGKFLQEIIKSKNNGIMPQLGKLKRKVNYKKGISIDVTNYLYELNQVDVVSTKGITGISEISALTIYSEIGDNFHCFKNEKHFTSWLGLAPNTKISGGKIISSHIPKKKQYAGQVFRMAAMSLCNNKGPLGDYYRRIRSTAGHQKAIVALARKLAVIYYRMMDTKEEYSPQSLIEYQEKWKERKIKNLERYLNKLKGVA